MSIYIYFGPTLLTHAKADATFGPLDEILLTIVINHQKGKDA
jgi:hypothetical protein